MCALGHRDRCGRPGLSVHVRFAPKATDVLRCKRCGSIIALAALRAVRYSRARVSAFGRRLGGVGGTHFGRRRHHRLGLPVARAANAEGEHERNFITSKTRQAEPASLGADGRLAARAHRSRSAAALQKTIAANPWRSFGRPKSPTSPLRAGGKGKPWGPPATITVAE